MHEVFRRIDTVFFENLRISTGAMGEPNHVPGLSRIFTFKIAVKLFPEKRRHCQRNLARDIFA